MSEPIEPPEMPNTERVVYAQDQPEYNPLVVRRNAEGAVLTKWHLNFEERQAILDGADILLVIHTFHQPLQPLLMIVEGVQKWWTD